MKTKVAMCEALLAAGFRPTRYPVVEFEARAPGDGEFIDRQAQSRFTAAVAGVCQPAGGGRLGARPG